MRPSEFDNDRRTKEPNSNGRGRKDEDLPRERTGRAGNTEAVEGHLSVLSSTSKAFAASMRATAAERRRMAEERERLLAREREARAEADAAREQVTNILESINDAFYALDRERRFTYVNRRAEQFWGKPREELVGRNVWEAFPQAVGSVSYQEIERVLEEGISTGFEAISPISHTWISARVYPSPDGVSVFFDITERKRSEEAVRESEARFRAVADLVPDLLWRNDPDGRTGWYNRRWTEYTGQSSEEALGSGWLEVIHPDDREHSLRNFQEAVKTGQPLRQEHRIRSVDGVYRWFLIQTRPLRDEGGHITQWFGAATDIHEQRTALEALREGEERLRLSLDAARAGSKEIDFATGELYSDERTREIYGFAPDHTFTYEEFLERVHPGDRERVRSAIDEAVREHKDYEAEYRVALPGGGIRWVLTRARITYHDDGDNRDPACMRCFVLDVTERKRAQEERERLLTREWQIHAEAEERQRISRELHDRVAHSMAVVHQSLELYEALRERNPSQAEARLKLARKEALEALNSTRNLSRELRDKDTENGLSAALSNLLGTAVPPGLERHVSVEGDETLVPPHVREQLFLILREGVRNTVSHSEAGRVTVGVEVDPERVVGSVEDDGRGLDGAEGNGIRSMRERVELVGGSFELSSAPEAGTKIRASIPLRGIPERGTESSDGGR